jgi:class 3 adenylate cyclase/rhodanese-related sulfurtransferase
MTIPAPRRLGPEQLHATLTSGEALLLLDVRRSEAFRRQSEGIPGAVPLTLDAAEPMLPDLPRDTPIASYCLCSGMASSTRVALWLLQAGYQDVCLLEGGLPAWQRAGLPLGSLRPVESVPRWMPVRPLCDSGGTRLIAETALLGGQALPLRRDMAVLFVDMVDSTLLLQRLPPEDMLALVQVFMETVVQVAVLHCGDVHDFQGDGAMLYFAGPGESVPAAFRLHSALAERRTDHALLPQARFALDYGPLVIGHIGTADRRSLSFIGPSINTAARILPLAPAGGIVATPAVVEGARLSDPDLAEQFRLLPGEQQLKGFETPQILYCAQPGKAPG